jgi:hypothetical protein
MTHDVVTAHRKATLRDKPGDTVSDIPGCTCDDDHDLCPSQSDGVLGQ